MGIKKKTGKDRLDKYYHLAKTQGYRARSAFKLIQLNKKYNFLEKSRVLIDLCAAPGGWLQVASKYMPVTSLIVGVDLAPIKPISRVITHVEDITTDSCRSTLKNDLKEWKADVVLHDGAPNVGTAWIQDAYAQSELVLCALKLAVEFLAPNGWFVTKVFRSKNYNDLMYIFNELFEKVEATKPHSSRNVSAEIFVVCKGYKAPKKLDPRFLDPQYVFKELDLTNGELISQGLAKSTIMYPEKEAKKRKRDGYNSDDYTLYHADSVVQFLRTEKEAEAIQMLAGLNEIKFKVGEDDGPSFELLKRIESHKETTSEVRECLADLKVLGRKDYKSLLRWRKILRSELFPAEEKESDSEEGADKNEEVDSAEELERLADEIENADKKHKKKKQKKLVKERRRMQLNMITPTDIGVEAAAGAVDDIGYEELPDKRMDSAVLFDTAKLKKEVKTEAIEVAEGEMDAEQDLESSESESEGGSVVEFSDEEQARFAELDGALEEDYDDFVHRQNGKDAKLKVRKKKLIEEEEFTGIDGLKGEESSDEESDASIADSFDSESDAASNISDDYIEEDKPAVELSKEAKNFFNQSMFREIDENEENKKPEKKLSKKEQKKVAKIAAFQQESDDSDVDLKQESKQEKPFVDPKSVLSNAEAVSLALKMVQDGGRLKRDAIDDFGYRRNVFGDLDSLPSWFADDERKHNKPNLPISKEAVELIKQRQSQLNDRPIKKVVEAKARKKQKALKKLDGLRQKMNAIVDEGGVDDPELGAKLGQVQSTMKKAMQKAKSATRRKVELVVARGRNKGNKGRPKGVKGQYKMVDSRMKKELRAQKRIEKKKRK